MSQFFKQRYSPIYLAAVVWPLLFAGIALTMLNLAIDVPLWVCLAPIILAGAVIVAWFFIKRPLP